MAWLPAILGAVAKAVWRDLPGSDALRANNFFVVCVLFLRQAGVFLLVIVALLLLFPLASDPMRKVPPERLASWPISRRGHIALRLLSIWLSPAMWITAVLILVTSEWGEGLRFLALAVGMYAVITVAQQIAVRAPGLNLLLHVPGFAGPWGELVRKSLRDMMSFLDFYCALAIAVCGIAYRFAFPGAEPEAMFPVTLLVVLALSTYAQTLFAVDAPGSFMRYRLLPVRGWQVLAAKNVAYLGITTVLTIALDPLSGLVAALVCLIFGNHVSVRKPLHEHRWRFVAGVSIGFGLIQVAAMIASATFTHRESPWFAVPLAGLWLLSVVVYGWRLERMHGIGNGAPVRQPVHSQTVTTST